MGRVKFKHAQGGELPVRRKLLGILAGSVQVFRLFPANDGIVVITSNEKDMDTIFSAEMCGKLESEGFTPLMPPELKSQRTVICFGLDDLAYDNSPQEIKAELEGQNEWLSIQEVYKFPKTNTIKITCASSAIAKKATEAGILMFCLSIPPSQLRVEDYVPLLACDRCHKVEQHATSQCPEPKNSKLCSECGSDEHTFRACTSDTKYCVNCKVQGHSARAMRCPVRKQAHKDKQAQKKVEKTTRQASPSYAIAAAQKASPPSTIPQGTHSTPMICLMNAHLRNAVKPGTFQTALSSELARNGIPDVQLDPDQPSLEIVNLLSGNLLAHGATPLAAPQQATLPETGSAAAASTSPARSTDHSPTRTVTQSRSHSPVPSAPSTPEDSGSSDEEEEEATGEFEECTERTTADADDFVFKIFSRKGDTTSDPLTYKSLHKGITLSKFKVSHNGTEKCTEKALLLLKESEPLNRFCETLDTKVFDLLPKCGPWPWCREDTARSVTRSGRSTRHSKR